jgi:hypothetical protein
MVPAVQCKGPSCSTQVLPDRSTNQARLRGFSGPEAGQVWSLRHELGVVLEHRE